MIFNAFQLISFYITNNNYYYYYYFKLKIFSIFPQYFQYSHII